VLEGEAGIGKSTLWLAGVEAARERGLRVLSSEPAKAERGLAHTGLGDLFESVLDRVAPVLVPPGAARSRPTGPDSSPWTQGLPYRFYFTQSWSSSRPHWG
jgi:hypothetical protein